VVIKHYILLAPSCQAAARNSLMTTVTFLGLIKSPYLIYNRVTRHAVAVDVLDGRLHDLLIDLLAERDIFTEYELILYVALLEGTKKFVS
jgi:hypothetical protein